MGTFVSCCTPVDPDSHKAGRGGQTQIGLQHVKESVARLVAAIASAINAVAHRKERMNNEETILESIGKG
jgi:hypothetical protein